VVITKKYKAIKISRQGFLTDEKDAPIVCPIRDANCNFKCAWFTAENGIIYCRDQAIGALRPKPVQSFHLHTGPDVYDLDESIENHKTSY